MYVCVWVHMHTLGSPESLFRIFSLTTAPQHILFVASYRASVPDQICSVCWCWWLQCSIRHAKQSHLPQELESAPLFLYTAFVLVSSFGQCESLGTCIPSLLWCHLPGCSGSPLQSTSTWSRSGENVFFPGHSTKLLTSALYSSCPPPEHPTTAESSESFCK